jgi:plastocyanin
MTTRSARRLLLSTTAGLLVPFLQCARAASFAVTMNNNFFSPRDLAIAIGDTVTWTNVTPGTTHTSTSGNTNNCTTDGLWGSGNVLAHATFARTFTNFAAGAYPYVCTIHCALGMKASLTITNPANVPPSISLTNPIAGSRFRAPTNLTLRADASDTGGSVTNVQFFSGASLLGSVAGGPYNFTVNNLGAGNYSFTATAADNLGATATSAIVNVSVLGQAALTAPTRLTNGQFRFTVVGISNQTYTTEISTNLRSWLGLSTNVAPSSTFNVFDPSATNTGIRMYRVRQDL